MKHVYLDMSPSIGPDLICIFDEDDEQDMIYTAKLSTLKKFYNTTDKIFYKLRTVTKIKLNTSKNY